MSKPKRLVYKLSMLFRNTNLIFFSPMTADIILGHYLYIETTRANEAATATITSFPYYKYSTNNCEVRFFYHAFGANIGQLTVTIDHDAGQTSEIIVDGNSEDGWKSASVSVPEAQGYYTVNVIILHDVNL